VNEADVGVAQTRDVLPSEDLDRILDGGGSEVTRSGGGANGTGVVGRESATGRGGSASEDDVRGDSGTTTERHSVLVEGVAGLRVHRLRHVATEETRGRRHNVVKGGVEEKFGNGDSLTVLLNGDLDLRSRKSDRLHTNTLSQFRPSLIDIEVGVTHEVDRETRLNAEFRLLDGKLLKAKHRHRLEQNLLRPNLLNGGREGGV